MRKKKVKIIRDEDLLTINEFSKIVSIPSSQLRYYDEIGILLPTKRGDNNYRYYSPRQITIAKMIKVLQQLDIPLDEIKVLGEKRTPDLTRKLLRKHKTALACEISVMQEIHSILNMYHEFIREGMNVDIDEIEVSDMQEMKIILGEPTSFIKDDGFYNEFQRFRSMTHDSKMNLFYPVGGYFDSMKSFTKNPSRPDRFFSISPRGQARKESGLYLIGHTRGYYGVTNDLPKRMMDYAKKHKLEFEGPVYNLYLIDEMSTPNDDEYLLQVSVQINMTSIKITRRPKLDL